MAVQVDDLAAFAAFIERPEHADKSFELIGGEIVEKMPSNPYCSYVAMLIGSPMTVFVRLHKLGFVTGEAGGYRVGDDVYAPDVAFISKHRTAGLAKEGYNPVPPDLAVEVVSPTDSERKLTRKIVNYINHGVIVWAVYPDDQTVEVYIPGKDVIVLGRDGVLTAPTLLPNFELKVADIFPEEPAAE